jgi:hypothetical protein
VATSVLDVRDAFAPSPARVAGRSAAPTLTVRRRPPATVVAAGVVGVLEGLGLLAAGLTSLDGLLASPNRPAGWVVALALGLLAAWIVSCAGSGVTLVDGAGRRSMITVSLVELFLIGVAFVVATTTPLIPALPGDLPPAALALLAVAVPVGKLLLAGSPSAIAWVAAGPRTRETRPDPVAAHRLLCTLTIAGIGLALTALAVLTPTQAGPGPDVAGVVSDR